MQKGRLSALLEALLPKGIQLTATIYPVPLGYGPKGLATKAKIQEAATHEAISNH